MSDQQTGNQQLVPAIELENLSKRFELIAEAPSSVLELLISRLKPSRGTRKRSNQYLWAVNDVNLEVMPGDCVGIIGQNGSGKSTLLKLIARILRPTTGRITVRGRVSALLELGTGFHTDLTGRENIYLNASLLGLDRADIEAHFDEVVAFSELEEFINTPVKYYSSGMYMRLGFSIAVHVKPQILIVDEILAVGDQAFQEKCINHIYEMKQKGTTIVLVSHSLDLMRKLCTHLVWMEKGRMRAYGPAETLIQQYLTFLSKRGARSSTKATKAFERLGTGKAEIIDVRLLDGGGVEQDSFYTGDPMTIEIAYLAHEPIVNPVFGLAIYRQDDVHVTGPNTQLSGFQIDEIRQTGVIRYHIPKLPLLPANYELSVAVHDAHYVTTYDHHVRAYEFQVQSGGTRETFGLVEIPAQWEWEPQAALEGERA
ncbi:MAG: ABC transporter ATP-binding protein [Candidatus Promineifilaceae bacterium]|nr:ABC transporter ATP-binding protein [Candidatus Promineifilaceae bacterium]